MAEYDLAFSATSTADANTYKLIELPKELCGLIEKAIEANDTLSLKIKGQPGEDAVLCTSNTTYSMRSVVLSNSILIVNSPADTGPSDFSEQTVVISDQVKEIIELAPAVPKLHRLTSLLRGRVYDDSDEMMESQDETDESSLPFTYEDALRQIQASDSELEAGIKSKRILVINGELRPIAPAYLHRLLELILNVLVGLSLHHASASVERLTTSLAVEHDVPRTVSTQVMQWFGKLESGSWCMHVDDLVREIGLGILRHHQHEPIEQDILLEKWKGTVGDTFSDNVQLTLLSGNFLASNDGTLKYFPAATLPTDPAGRFGDLFATRNRWRGEDISPFLNDIAVDSKERDKLLLKYARAITDSTGVWYTARVQYNG